MENKIQKVVRKMQEENRSIVNLSFPDFSFYSSLLQETFVEKAFSQLFKYPYYYPTAQGDADAREAVSGYYREFGQELNPDRLILTSSINQAYLYLFKIFSSGEILLPIPHHPEIDEIANFLGLTLKTYALDPANNWQIDFSSLKKQISTKTKAIFLMSPGCPTGSVQSSATLTELFASLKGQNITVVADESLSDFIFEEKEFPILESFAEPNQALITLHGLANGFALPGLKLSWLTFHGSDQVCEGLMKAVEYLADTFLTLAQPVQAILPEIIAPSEKWRLKFQKQVEKNRDLTRKILKKSPKLEFSPAEGGFYCLIKPKESKLTDQELTLDLLKKTGLYLHPGAYYGLNSADSYLVLSFLQDPAILKKSLKNLVAYFKK